MSNGTLDILLRKSRNAPLEDLVLTGDIFEEAKKLINCSSATIIPLREDVSVIVDEEIIYKENFQDKTNFWYDSVYKNGKMVRLSIPQWIYGDVIFIGCKDNDFTPLSKEQKEFVSEYLFG